MEEGQEVTQGAKLMSTEAMKMLNVIVSPKNGRVKRILVTQTSELGSGDLVIELQS